MMKRAILGLLFAFSLTVAPLWGQEAPAVPYFVLYSAHMEDVDTLEINVEPVWGWGGGLNRFVGVLNEFEYGTRKWWTTEFYIDWQHTQHEGSLYTGFRIENRFRPFKEDHWINPVLYVEYAQLNGADKTLKEIVGFDNKEDLKVPNSIARKEHEKEIETKLILSSDIGLWNVAENFIGEKNLNGGRWEFGYAAGLSRPLAAPNGGHCAFCAQRFSAGVELYGGLGEWGAFTMNGTSQYVAPLLLWTLPSETTIRISPGWGLNDNSVPTLFRFGVSQEIDDFGRRIAKLFR